MDDRFRTSDADRDRVAALLRDHFAAGRLTLSELDERLTATLAAKTFGDLRRVLADLPGPAPVRQQASRFSPQASVIRRRGWIVLALTCICVIGALGYVLAAPKVYTATAAVYITPARAGQGIQLLPWYSSGSAGVNLDNQTRIVKSRAVTSIAVRLLHSKLTPSALDQEISVTERPNSQVLDISCQAPTGEAAAACANAVAAAYLQNRSAAAASSLSAQLKIVQVKLTSLQQQASALSTKINSLPPSSPARISAQTQLSSVMSQLNTLSALVATFTSQKADSSGGHIITRATASRSSA